MATDRVIWCNRGWQPVYFGFCPSEGAWRREMKKMGCADVAYPDTDARASTFDNNGKVCCIVTVRDGAEDKHTVSELAGLIVHEAVHIWQAVRDKMQEREPSIEFEAYSVQAIFQELWSAWEATRGKKPEAPSAQ